jgi:RNA recognition motif-containing protein
MILFVKNLIFIFILFFFFLKFRWGEIVDVHLVRDKKTGKSKGYCFLAYED